VLKKRKVKLAVYLSFFPLVIERCRPRNPQRNNKSTNRKSRTRILPHNRAYHCNYHTKGIHNSTKQADPLQFGPSIMYTPHPVTYSISGVALRRSESFFRTFLGRRFTQTVLCTDLWSLQKCRKVLAGIGCSRFVGRGRACIRSSLSEPPIRG
jgi:hypothetical protein